MTYGDFGTRGRKIAWLDTVSTTVNPIMPRVVIDSIIVLSSVSDRPMSSLISVIGITVLICLLCGNFYSLICISNACILNISDSVAFQMVGKM